MSIFTRMNKKQLCLNCKLFVFKIHSQKTLMRFIQYVFLSDKQTSKITSDNLFLSELVECYKRTYKRGRRLFQSLSFVGHLSTSKRHTTFTTSATSTTSLYLVFVSPMLHRLSLSPMPHHERLQRHTPHITYKSMFYQSSFVFLSVCVSGRSYGEIALCCVLHMDAQIFSKNRLYPMSYHVRYGT